MHSLVNFYISKMYYHGRQLEEHRGCIVSKRNLRFRDLKISFTDKFYF